MTPYDRMNDNLKAVVRAFKECEDIILKYDIEQREQINPKTKRKILFDAKITIWATKSFAVEQITTNELLQEMDKAVLTNDKKVLIEPKKKDYPNYSDYREDLLRYMHGQKITPRNNVKNSKK